MTTLPALDPEKNVCYSPHVVLLGAGASRAACPAGDRNGRQLPLMDDLPDLINLDALLRQHEIERPLGDFEGVYSSLASQGHEEAVEAIEARVGAYFSALELPGGVTLYDRLLLSLRPKDVIATFNWDPFLIQAYARNARMERLPHLIFLHGNVAVGICNDDRRKGRLGERCQTCNEPLAPTKLLFPVEKKNYTEGPFIQAEWDAFRDALEHAYMFTIFGYSAPATDAEAKNIMHQVWDANESQELAEIHIVDIKSEDELKRTWRPFFVRDHYGISENLAGSWLFRHPRRSCDAFAMATLQLQPCESNPLPQFDRLDDLHDWIQPLIDEEVALEESGEPLGC